MGRKKNSPGKSAISILDRRSLFISAVIIISLALGLILQGCGSQPAEEQEAIVEEMAESEEDTEEETEGEGVAWCESDGDLYVSLPTLGDEAADGITVEICIPGGDGYTVETYEGELEDLEITRELKRPFDIYAFLTYFKVKNGDELITTFDTPLQMRITYSSVAWNAILERDYDVPRIAYLPWEGSAWAAEWLELEVNEENIHAPGEDGPDGFLEIFIEELSDPLIGGC